MNLIKHSMLYILISLIVLIPGIVSLFVYGLNLAIDYTGGSVVQYESPAAIENIEEVENSIKEVFSAKSVEIENILFERDNLAVVRTKPMDVNQNEEIKTEIQAIYPNLNQISFETVGPAVGVEAAKDALIAIGLATLGILLYIAYSFRNVPKPYSSFRFGVAAVAAMLHDALVVIGIFSILGHFLGVEIDALFITALLTIIGFSVHDTIVVFDRIRENLRKLPSSWGFSEVVNYSLVETLNRSLVTSLTVIIVLSALYLLGGESIKYFSLALLIGIISGTYSSLFNASPILVLWEAQGAKKGRQK